MGPTIYLIIEEDKVSNLFHSRLKESGWQVELLSLTQAEQKQEDLLNKILIIDEKEIDWFDKQKFKNNPVFVIADEPEEASKKINFSNLKGVFYKSIYEVDEMVRAVDKAEKQINGEPAKKSDVVDVYVEEQEKALKDQKSQKTVSGNDIVMPDMATKPEKYHEKSLFQNPKFMITLGASLLIIMVVSYFLFKQAIYALKVARNNSSVSNQQPVDNGETQAIADFNDVSKALNSFNKDKGFFPKGDGLDTGFSEQMNILVEFGYLDKVPISTDGKYSYSSDGEKYQLKASTSQGFYIVHGP